MGRLITSEEIYLAEHEVAAAEAAFIRTQSPTDLENWSEARRSFEGLLAQRYDLFDE